MSATIHNEEITSFARTNFRNQDKTFGIKIDDRRRHMYLIGKTGMGKTTVIENMVISDIRAGKGLALVLVGYVGSIGIATLSDSLLPFAGEILLQLPNPGLHIGFIEKWWLVNPLAFLGIAIAYWRPTTKFPHAGHVLLSTWASAFHIIMALGDTVSWITLLIIGLFLFLSVWLPCCLSDIIFPLLFVSGKAANHDGSNNGR